MMKKMLTYVLAASLASGCGEEESGPKGCVSDNDCSAGRVCNYDFRIEANSCQDKERDDDIPFESSSPEEEIINCDNDPLIGNYFQDAMSCYWGSITRPDTETCQYIARRNGAEDYAQLLVRLDKNEHKREFTRDFSRIAPEIICRNSFTSVSSSVTPADILDSYRCALGMNHNLHFMITSYNAIGRNNGWFDQFCIGESMFVEFIDRPFELEACLETIADDWRTECFSNITKWCDNPNTVCD